MRRVEAQLQIITDIIQIHIYIQERKTEIAALEKLKDNYCPLLYNDTLELLESTLEWFESEYMIKVNLAKRIFKK